VHYGGSSQRADEVAGHAKIAERIGNLKNEIKHGDDELSSFSDRNPYNTFELMQKAQAWRHKRFRLEVDLANLERAKQYSAPDTEWKPATPGFVGSDS
jgi:hypothetical protein